MTEVTFFNSDSHLVGFKVKGHSGYAEEGYDIICSAVSSAAYMTANTITDVIFVSADIKERDGFLELKLTSSQAVSCQTILEGFKLHMFGLAEQYSKYIKVIISEV